MTIAWFAFASLVFYSSVLYPRVNGQTTSAVSSSSSSTSAFTNVQTTNPSFDDVVQRDTFDNGTRNKENATTTEDPIKTVVQRIFFDGPTNDAKITAGNETKLLNDEKKNETKSDSTVSATQFGEEKEGNLTSSIVEVNGNEVETRSNAEASDGSTSTTKTISTRMKVESTNSTTDRSSFVTKVEPRISNVESARVWTGEEAMKVQDSIIDLQALKYNEGKKDNETREVLKMKEDEYEELNDEELQINLLAKKFRKLPKQRRMQVLRRLDNLISKARWKDVDEDEDKRYSKCCCRRHERRRRNRIPVKSFATDVSNVNNYGTKNLRRTLSPDTPLVFSPMGITMTTMEPPTTAEDIAIKITEESAATTTGKPKKYRLHRKRTSSRRRPKMAFQKMKAMMDKKKCDRRRKKKRRDETLLDKDDDREEEEAVDYYRTHFEDLEHIPESTVTPNVDEFAGVTTKQTLL